MVAITHNGFEQKEREKHCARIDRKDTDPTQAAARSSFDSDPQAPHAASAYLIYGPTSLVANR